MADKMQEKAGVYAVRRLDILTFWMYNAYISKRTEYWRGSNEYYEK